MKQGMLMAAPMESDVISMVKSHRSSLPSPIVVSVTKADITFNHQVILFYKHFR